MRLLYKSGNIAGEVPECQQCKVLGWWVGSRESDERTWVPVTNWVSEDVIGDREDGGSISLSAALLDTRNFHGGHPSSMIPTFNF